MQILLNITYICYCPPFVLQMFVAFGPSSFLIFCLVILLIACGLYWVLMWIGKGTRKHQGKQISSNYTV